MYFSVAGWLLVWAGTLDLWVGATCDWNEIHREMKCDLRTLDYKRNLTMQHQSELRRAASLELACSDVLLLESALRSDHFGGLTQLHSLAIERCKIRTLPPRSFVGLESLERLTIRSHNEDWGDILLHIDYEAFVGLERLKSLDLANNNIYETPVKLFCPLSSVETIDLRNNRLVNLEDLGLSNRTEEEQCEVSVTKLDVSANRVKTLSPGALAATTRLQSLIVSHNEVSVLDRMTLHSLTQLRIIDLSHNALAALPPDLFLDNSELREVSLADNTLGTIHPSVFRNLSRLEKLNLSHNSLDENWIRDDLFADLTSLKSLDLSHNHLSSIDNGLLAQLKMLEHLDLSHNRLSSLGSQVVSQLTQLTSLSLAHNRLESVSLFLFSSAPGLQSLALNNNKLQSLPSEIFRNLTALTHLSLSRNLLSQLPSSMSDLKRLNHLDVSINIIGVISPKDIQGISNLTFLNLSSNDISRIDLATFNQTPSLQYLDLSNNRLQALNQSSFAALGNLTHLDLADNNLEDINGLLTMQMQLEHLNISSNRLHWFDYAFVPNSLKTLDIHNNQIDSVENYYSLRDGFQLEFLDASRNRIRALGVLSLLPSLRTIILRNNKISDIGHNTFLNKDNLTHVDLRDNRISVTNIAALAVSKTLKTDKPTFLMAANPFHCSCEMQWMVNPAYSDRLPLIADLEEAECLVNYYGNTTATARMVTVPSTQFLCQYESHCFSLCMCCDFFGCDCRMQCPDGCSCFHDATWSSNIIQCSARGHADIPALIPMDATSVFLDGNRMTDLSGQIFLGRSRMKNLYLNNSGVTEVSNNSFVGLQDLQLLDLSDNMLSVLSGLEFTDLVNLRELYLQNNKIVHIAEETFRPLQSLSVLRLDNNLLTSFPVWELASNPFMIGLYIAKNVWTCECEFVSKFRMFIDGNLDKVMDAREVQCIVNSVTDEGYSKSGRNCVESTNAAYRTQSTTDFGAMGIIIGCCIMFLALLFLIFAMYKMQDTLMLWIHAKYGIRIPTKNTMVDNNDKLFDAYFSYCLKDEPCVSQMARELPGYRLCLHQQSLLGNNRNPAEMGLSAAKAAARTVIVISKAFLASEWDYVKTFLLGPESGDISGNVIIILLEDMFEYENIQNFEVKTFINSSQHILRWRECKFWAKLKYLLPDPIMSGAALDKTALSQLDHSEFWTRAKSKEVLDSGVSSAAMSQASLSQAQVARSDSLKFKTKSRQSLPSSVESNNEFIYLTPKPKKAHPHPGHDDGTHQRSSSEVYQQQQPQYGQTYHQRSRSTQNSGPVCPPYYDDRALQEPMIPLNPANIYNQIPESQDPGRQIYGSTSFIYKLISSGGAHDTPTLPMSGDLGQYRHHSSQQQIQHHRSRSSTSQQQQQQQQPQHIRAWSHNGPQYQPQPGHQGHQGQHYPMSAELHMSHPMSLSSSQLSSARQSPARDLRSSTLAGGPRREARHPPPPPPPGPQHQNSTLNILEDILHRGQSSPSGGVIHQRSKSTPHSPYNGFVV